jgi:hypothetical protein
VTGVQKCALPIFDEKIKEEVEVILTELEKKI